MESFERRVFHSLCFDGASHRIVAETMHALTLFEYHTFFFWVNSIRLLHWGDFYKETVHAA